MRQTRRRERFSVTGRRERFDTALIHLMLGRRPIPAGQTLPFAGSARRGVPALALRDSRHRSRAALRARLTRRTGQRDCAQRPLRAWAFSLSDAFLRAGSVAG